MMTTRKKRITQCMWNAEELTGEEKNRRPRLHTWELWICHIHLEWFFCAFFWTFFLFVRCSVVVASGLYCFFFIFSSFSSLSLICPARSRKIKFDYAHTFITNSSWVHLVAACDCLFFSFSCWCCYCCWLVKGTLCKESTVTRSETNKQSNQQTDK